MGALRPTRAQAPGTRSNCSDELRFLVSTGLLETAGTPNLGGTGEQVRASLSRIGAWREGGAQLSPRQAVPRDPVAASLTQLVNFQAPQSQDAEMLQDAGYHQSFVDTARPLVGISLSPARGAPSPHLFYLPP